ncbi:type II secretion system F family protein [Sulfuriflexus mobilis]|uniref:type II secretion system F family protein n=1 Tax=Sulfuriflexus mobilis TaxID=1811807 RepID=UPI000F832DD7|nr:type II secretion system F family protein [Sulfuriflexus mobilis]
MGSFHYKGRTNHGDAIEGNIEAVNADVVAAQLLNSGVTPIDISETKVTKSKDIHLGNLFGPGVKLDDLVLFSRQMYTLMKSGVPIVRSITSLAESTRNPALSKVLRNIVEDLESGRELSHALSRHPKIFTNLYVSIIQVGENTGRLDESFQQIAAYQELEKDTRDRIKTAMRYPIVVILTIVAAIAIINLFVIPAFAKIYAKFHADLPWATKFLIATSNFTVANWPYILAGLILGGVGINMYLKTEAGRYKWHKYKLRLPIVGSIVNRSLLARFSRSFAMAMRAGVPLIQTMTVVSRAADNDYLAARILQMRNGIERGDTLTRTAAATGMFTPLVLQMMAVGEETGAIDELMLEVAEYYEREVDYDLKNLSSAIEPIMIVIIGIMVFVLALGVFLPMWDLAAVARG